MTATIGIDLGTTNSCAATVEGGRPAIVPNAEGERTTPSVVAFSKDGERLVGAIASRQAAVNPDRTISSVKRRMGSDWRASIDGKAFTPQELSAMILRKLRRDAEAFLGQDVTQAVITVPAYFDDAQRQATKDAGKIAGLDVLRIINEPTAAALAYGLDNGTPQKVMVYDLGGGTFDVSIIEIGDGVIEVLATSGDNHLGGDDFDERVANYLLDTFQREHGEDLRRNPMAVQRVREAAEQAKKELSSLDSAHVNLPFLAQNAGGPLHLDATVTRAATPCWPARRRSGWRTRPTKRSHRRASSWRRTRRSRSRPTWPPSASSCPRRWTRWTRPTWPCCAPPPSSWSARAPAPATWCSKGRHR